MRKGISMVALVITIIVLIVLTSAVVITGVGAPKQAQLATFYSNVATVQELVTLKMSENMITEAQKGYGVNYKWVGIVDGFGLENEQLIEPDNAFSSTLEGIEENIAPIKSTLLEQTTLAIGEKEKYYVGESGKVYYQGFEYQGKTYYNKDTTNEGTNNQSDVVVPPNTSGITADMIKLNPADYYGAYVNYRNALNEPFIGKDGDNNDYDLQWRIFYSDGDNIYITTSNIVERRFWTNVCGTLVLEDLRADKSTYKNETYAEWVTDGIQFSMFARSYNSVKGSYATMQLSGTEEEGFAVWEATTAEYATSGNNRHIARLSGLQADLYNYGSGSYCLASKESDSNGDGNCVMHVICASNYANDYDTGSIKAFSGNYTYGPYGSENVRPLACLKHDVQLVESGVSDANGYMTYNLSVSPVQGGITASNIENYPMEYYGAVVNYTNELGQPYKDKDGQDIEWRIFHAEDGYIYLTTSKAVDERTWCDEALENVILPELREDKATYKNVMYADWASDAMTYEMFRNSYEEIVQDSVRMWEGNEEIGYTYLGRFTYEQPNRISKLTGLQEDLYVIATTYCLASWSPTNYNINYLMCISGYPQSVEWMFYGSTFIRPLICLKSNVQLVESGVEDANGNAYDLILQQP